MIVWGINALNHDASIAVFKNSELVFWDRSSKYSGIDHDQMLDGDVISAAIDAGGGRPNEIVWYERPWLKKSRQLYAGQYRWAFDLDELPSRYLKEVGLGGIKIHYLPHHLSHAAAGFLTSPFEDATVVVLDAMGEWDTATIWQGQGTQLTKLWSRKYPSSLGLFYSAFTGLIGYKPVAEEYLLQRDSALGDPNRYYHDVLKYFNGIASLTTNLHCGVLDWPYAIESVQDRYDIAAAVQRVFEIHASLVMDVARHLGSSKNLVYMGGCAMNSKFNRTLIGTWDDIWTFKVPGDSSSSIGAALYHMQHRIDWK
jgi:carbamoyltransferase